MIVFQFWVSVGFRQRTKEAGLFGRRSEDGDFSKTKIIRIFRPCFGPVSASGLPGGCFGMGFIIPFRADPEYVTNNMANAKPIRRNDRVAEGARLESVCTPKGYREFESRFLRQ